MSFAESPPPGWRPHPQPPYPQQAQPYPQQAQPYPQQYPYPQQPYPSQPPRDPMQVFQVSPHLYARGKNLVFWSRMMVLGGFLVSFAGCGAYAATSWGGAVGLGVLTCAIMVVAAAVVGTIGRRLQGRIV